MCSAEADSFGSAFKFESGSVRLQNMFTFCSLVKIVRYVREWFSTIAEYFFHFLFVCKVRARVQIGGVVSPAM